jgi:hypothetical protein
MGWAYVGAGTMDATSAVDPSINPGAPGGSGGVLFLSIWASAVTPSDPSGWTLAVAQTRTRLLWRIADGTATDTPTVTATGTTGLAAQIARFSGGPTTVTGNVDSTAGNGAPTSGDIPTASITTPAGDGRLIIYTGAVVAQADHTPFDTFPNGSTEIDSAWHDFSTDFTVAWSYAIQTTAAAVGASSFDQATSANTGTARAVTASFIPSGLDKYVKLLADASAASDTAVAGRVFNGDDYIGAFTGQAWEADLESGEAVLLVPVADITPDGATLTTSDTPTVFAYNATDATSGPGDATVIEV